MTDTEQPIAGIDVVRARCAALRLDDIDPLWADAVRRLAALGMSVLQEQRADERLAATEAAEALADYPPEDR